MSLPDESHRQRELDSYKVVDTLPEAAYDDIARLATLVCGVPIALVSLIDRERQWFKARSGFEPGETRRDEAFCDHAIREPGRLMEVPDATRRARGERRGGRARRAPRAHLPARGDGAVGSEGRRRRLSRSCT
jgi:hypothetical protein